MTMTKNSGVGSVLGGLLALGALSGCGPDSSYPVGVTAPGPSTSGLEPLFAGKTTRANAKVAPISGGTLLVTKDGHAVVSDPDRDAVHVVDLATQKVASIALQEGDEPGRVVAGPDGTAFVAARRGGVVLAIDTAQATAKRFPVCAAPRGVAYDGTLSKLYVACRSGVLAELDASTGAVTARHRLDGDLRDVLISGDNLVVTRFKNAELLVVSRAGEVLRRSTPDLASSSGGLGVSAAAFTPAVAFRALSLPGGGVLVGHVDSSDTTLPSGVGAYYGASCGGSVADLSVSIMNPYAGTDRASISTSVASRLGGASGPLDIAVSPDGQRVAMLASGNSWEPTRPITTRFNMWLTSSATLESACATLRLASSIAVANNFSFIVIPRS